MESMCHGLQYLHACDEVYFLAINSKSAILGYTLNTLKQNVICNTFPQATSNNREKFDWLCNFHVAMKTADKD